MLNSIVIPIDIGCTSFNGLLAILVNASIETLLHADFALLQVRIFYPSKSYHSISYDFAYGPVWRLVYNRKFESHVDSVLHDGPVQQPDNSKRFFTR